MCCCFFAIVQASVKGMGCPPAEEMKMVVTSAGGQWLPQIPKVSNRRKDMEYAGVPGLSKYFQASQMQLSQRMPGLPCSSDFCRTWRLNSRGIGAHFALRPQSIVCKYVVGSTLCPLRGVFDKQYRQPTSFKAVTGTLDIACEKESPIHD